MTARQAGLLAFGSESGLPGVREYALLLWRLGVEAPAAYGRSGALRSILALSTQGGDRSSRNIGCQALPALIEVSPSMAEGHRPRPSPHRCRDSSPRWAECRSGNGSGALAVPRVRKTVGLRSAGSSRRRNRADQHADGAGIEAEAGGYVGDAFGTVPVEGVELGLLLGRQRVAVYGRAHFSRTRAACRSRARSSDSSSSSALVGIRMPASHFCTSPWTTPHHQATHS